MHTCIEPVPGLAVSESFICLLSEKRRKKPSRVHAIEGIKLHLKHENVVNVVQPLQHIQILGLHMAWQQHTRTLKKNRFQLQTPTYQFSRRHLKTPAKFRNQFLKKARILKKSIDSLDSLLTSFPILSFLKVLVQQSYAALGWQGGGPANVITLTMPTFLDGFHLETAR